MKVLLILGNLASSAKTLITRILMEGGYILIATLCSLLIEQQNLSIDDKLIEVSVLVVAKIANRGSKQDILPFA